MALATALIEAPALATVPMSYWRTVAWRLARDRATLIAGGVLAVIVLSAVLAPWLAPYDPAAGSIRLRLAPVGAPGHVLGTDEQGRDMLSRLLWGGRMTLVAGLTPVLVAFVLGTALGVMAGYVGGLTNMLIMRTMDIFYAFPAVLLAIAISGALGPGLPNTLISLSIVFVPRVVRVAPGGNKAVHFAGFSNMDPGGKMDVTNNGLVFSPGAQDTVRGEYEGKLNNIKVTLDFTSVATAHRTLACVFHVRR
jgi:peptide/nickel transport system permease protein